MPNDKEATKQPPPSGLAKGKILIVEDDAMIMEMYSMRLKEDGYEVFQAVDGAEGVKLAHENAPDIILLDIILPKLDGFSVLAKIKADDKAKNAPVIILTNLGQESDVKKGQELGAVDYMVKASMTPTQVLEKIKHHLGKK